MTELSDAQRKELHNMEIKMMLTNNGVSLSDNKIIEELQLKVFSLEQRLENYLKMNTNDRAPW